MDATHGERHTRPDIGSTLDSSGALGWARMIADGSLSCLEATQHCLQRIEADNDALGAFVACWPSRALAAARKLDRARARGGPMPSQLFGIPIGIKDLDPVRGTVTRMGSRAYRYLWTPNDGPVSGRLRAGGCNLVGKTTTSEFAIMPITEPAIHPPCRNAIDPRYTCGGSSGGAATAVASGMLPIAHGSDGAGSIRIPASLGGLFGFKPSRGLLPNFYGHVDKLGLGVVGALSRDVPDSAAFLDLLRGVRYPPDAAPEGSLLAAVRTPPAPMRIAYSLESPVTAVRPEVAAGIEATAQRLAELGHEVARAPMLPAGVDDFLPLWERFAANVPLLSERLAEPTTRYLRERGRRHPLPEVQAAAAALTADVLAWFGDRDAWLTPTIGPAPPQVGALAPLDAKARFDAAAPLGAFTAAFNVSGQPAGSVPVGRCGLGLPFGAQLVGRVGDDARLLALCHALHLSVVATPFA